MPDTQILKTQRGRLKGSLTKIQTFAERINADTAIDDITARLEKLEEIWNAFVGIDDELTTREIPSEVDEVEEKYYNAKAKLRRELRQRLPPDTTGPSASTNDDVHSTMIRVLEQQKNAFDCFSQSFSGFSQSSNGSSLEVKLPKIHIPTFNGDYKNWPSFKDLFTSSVHEKSSLSNVHKFQYLMSALKDEAASLIKHITITDSNYIEAWNKLNARYDKKKQIPNSYIKSFVNQPLVSQSSSMSLRKLTDSSDELIRGIKSLGSDASSRDPWLIFLLLTKCDPETRQAWSEETAEIDLPTFDCLIKFLNKRCDALESNDSAIRKPSVRSVRTLHAKTTTQCRKCTQSHELFHCPDFKHMDTPTKRSFVHKTSLCFNCLGSGHSAQNCKSKSRCHRCSKLHHTTLHLQETASASHVPPQSLTFNDQLKPINANSHSSTNQYIPSSSTNISRPELRSTSQVTSLVSSSPPWVPLCLLPTALVQVVDSYGRLQPCRVLVDSGSTSSFITDSCAQRLGLQREHSRVRVNGLGLASPGFTKGSVSLTLCSRFDASQQITITALILSKLTSRLPTITFRCNDWTFLNAFDLADPAFNIPSKIDILLGADHALSILRDGHHTISPDLPVIQNTIFGHIIAGNISTPQSTTLSLHADVEDVENLLKKFWELEELPSQNSQFSEEEKYCETHFASTHYIDEETGRYVVRLPFKSNTPPLGDTASAAISQLQSVERRFKSQPKLQEEYINFLKEYEVLKHLEPIPQQVLTSPNEHAYLPHHAVLKPSSTSTKLRVVFNGSANSGISLNSKLCVGPRVQPDLYPILLNFRLFKVSITADIEKMYRQILVDTSDRNYQRIVWRDEPNKPEQHLWLTTVTYGTASAPFLATRALKQLTIDFKNKFPLAEIALNNSFYVDDLMSGADEVPTAVTLYKELTTLLQLRGFSLRKWTSNSKEFLNALPDHHSSSPVQVAEHPDTIKVLGLTWIPSEDVFTFDVNLPNQLIMTKRRILSDSSRIFDPLGLISPVIVRCKILLQEIWKGGYQWDEPLPDQIAQNWRNIALNLPSRQTLRIPRWLRTTQCAFELHGFADASEDAYAAVVYCRSTSTDGDISVTLVTSKTKVAPIKQVSIPRLELCSVVLLTRLLGSVKCAFQNNNVKCIAWTDSTVVLAWLSSEPRRWKCFIGNRTAEVLSSLPRHAWHHVSSEDNPADLASRGVSTSELLTSSLWWNGPPWLQSNWQEHLRDETLTESTVTAQKELRPRFVTSYVVSIENNTLENLFMRVSSITKIVRIIARCLRFAHHSTGHKSQTMNSWISTIELNKAWTICIRWAQLCSFETEIKNIRVGKPVPRSSTLNTLSPFLDSNGLLRVKGRLDNSTCSYNAKHPLILPKTHIFTLDLISHLHTLHLHAGVSLLLNIVRQIYWIIFARTAIKRHINKCIKCIRHRAQTMEQQMADLPESRVSLTRAFDNVGVDYAGPLHLLRHRGRGAKKVKGYIALFTCLGTRAIHLEAVSELTSDAFIACLKRFISRRGLPTNIYSDNGTNFVGANRKLNEVFKQISSNNHNSIIADFLSSRRVTWHFTPPAAPHFGGSWESGVKLIKHHLRRTVGDSSLTFEELSTLLCQIEALVNSRPLVQMSSDVHSLDALTPAHFLIGQPMVALPEQPIETGSASITSRWRLLQRLHQTFWRRWHIEYLTTLQQRPRWASVSDNINIDDLVLVKEENLPPTSWLLARVLSTHTGNDNLVRVVTLKTAKGVIKRPIVKLCKLPIS